MKRVLLLAAVSLTACGSPLPPGDNFVSEGKTTILLNRHQGQWTAYVNGEKQANSQVMPTEAGRGKERVVYELQIGGQPLDDLPHRFQLQVEQNANGVISPVKLKCDACSADRRDWDPVFEDDPFKWFKRVVFP